MDALLGVSARFERMVVGASIAVLVSGLATAWLLSTPILGALQGAATNWLLVSLALFLVVLLFVPPLVFLPAGRTFDAARSRAARIGTKTPELQAAFGDRRVRLAHIAEFAGVVVIIGLMVLKPF